MPSFLLLFLLFLLLSQFGILAQKRRPTISSAVHHPISPSQPRHRHSTLAHHPFGSRIGRAHQHSQLAVVHPPGIKPPKGVAGTLNKAKLKDFMRIGREILRKRRVFRARVRQQ